MQFALPFELNTTVLGILLAVAIFVLGGLGAAFIYHWREYGMNSPLSKAAPALYLSISGLLCAFALVSYVALF